MILAEHTTTALDSDLLELSRMIAEMGGLAERQILEAMGALDKRDQARARQVIAADAAIDAMQRTIEARAIEIIVRWQPAVNDLRKIVGISRIANELERIGDLAKNIGKRALAIAGQFQSQKIVVGVQHMADQVLGQLKDVLDAYAQQNPEAALDVWRRDGQIDALYTSLFRELLTYMMEDPRNISLCVHLLFCAKNIERIGDHTTNVAETIYYLATGETLAIERPKNDRSIVAADSGER